MESREVCQPNDELRKKERDFVGETFATIRVWRQCNIDIQFPEKRGGLVMVDVGAGVSESTAILASQGAISIAVDPRYRDINELILNAKEHLVPDFSGFSQEEEDKCFERFRQDFKSKKRRRGHYLIGLAGDLPFRDESVDFLFSNRCITFFLDRDWDLLKGAVDESLRVLKKGGEIQLSPFFEVRLAYQISRIFEPELFKIFEEDLDENLARDENQKRLFDYLSAQSSLEVEIGYTTRMRGDTPIKIPMNLTIKKK